MSSLLEPVFRQSCACLAAGSHRAHGGQFFLILQKCRRCWNRFSGHVVLFLLNAAGAAGCRALHGVGGRVERGAGGGLVARPVVYQVLKRGICFKVFY